VISTLTTASSTSEPHESPESTAFSNSKEGVKAELCAHGCQGLRRDPTSTFWPKENAAVIAEPARNRTNDRRGAE
jgi:hypothetical protein